MAITFLTPESRRIGQDAQPEPAQHEPAPPRDAWTFKQTFDGKFAAANLARLHRSLDKLWRFDGHVMSVREWLYEHRAEITHKSTYTQEYTSGRHNYEYRKLTAPKVWYNVCRGDVSVSVAKIVYDSLDLPLVAPAVVPSPPTPPAPVVATENDSGDARCLTCPVRGGCSDVQNDIFPPNGDVWFGQNCIIAQEEDGPDEYLTMESVGCAHRLS